MQTLKLKANFKARPYQEALFANSINNNTLITLPTGLGKTIIALMQSVYFYNKTKKKILFLAPTKPLVEQHKKSFEELIETAIEMQTLTGLISPKKREELYKSSQIIFSTPQLIQNDIINNILNPKEIGLLIIDEAHRGTGNYSYCFIAEALKDSSHILALTASPGTSKDEIETIMKNLHIENIEVKKYEDSDVKPFVQKTDLKHIEVELTKELKTCQALLQKVIEKKVNILKHAGFLKQKRQLSKRDLLELQSELRKDIAKGDTDEVLWSAISQAAGLMKLHYAIELVESQEISAAHTYMYNFFRSGGDSSKAAQELTIDIDFRECFDLLSKLKKENKGHPKIPKLKELISETLNKNKDIRTIIFNQYRDTAQILVKELEKIKEIKPAMFVGQSKKGDSGMSQKKQQELINEFREGKVNTLISTSVGEEGLDIPKVDLVIFYEPVPSAIRTIQRIGRTGRFKKGEAFILQTKGTRDIINRHVASAKERRMYKALDEIKTPKKEVKGLKQFLEEKKEPPKLEVERDERIPILVDSRENNDLLKALYKSEEIKVEAKKLEIGDIIITDKIAIERKAKIDFINSLLDKRLFPQLIDLAKNFQRPILILEGEENIYSVRNLKPEMIRGALVAVAVDLRIPIIETANLNETSQMITTIAKRAKKDKKDISLAGVKTAYSEKEELEKFVSSIPKINVVTAKSLLKHFKSIEKLVNAKQEKLEKVEGVGKTRAKSLKEFFEREYM